MAKVVPIRSEVTPLEVLRAELEVAQRLYNEKYRELLGQVQFIPTMPQRQSHYTLSDLPPKELCSLDRLLALENQYAATRNPEIWPELHQRRAAIAIHEVFTQLKELKQRKDSLKGRITGIEGAPKSCCLIQ